MIKDIISSVFLKNIKKPGNTPGSMFFLFVHDIEIMIFSVSNDGNIDIIIF